MISLGLENQFPSCEVGLDGLTLMDATVENFHAQRIEDLLLDHALEGTCTIGRVVSLLGKICPGLGAELQMELLGAKTLL